MFISRIPLNAGRYGAQQLISSPYRMHAAVEACFPPSVPRQTEEGRILWRLDFNEETHSVWLYVVSPAKPDFTNIVEQAGWPMYQEWESKDYAPVLSRINVGAHFNFRLRANPVHRVLHDKFAGQEKPRDGKRLGHVTVEQQSQWLIDRSASNGFSVLQRDDDYQMVVSQRKKERFQRTGQSGQRKGNEVTISTALFDGLLEVTDAEKFRHALCFGVGRAKGFGCGLLTVAPIKVNPSAAESGK